MMTRHVAVDRDLCIGSANCVHLAPGAFQLDDEEIAGVVDDMVASEEELLAAERSCPTSAIIIEKKSEG